MGQSLLGTEGNWLSGPVGGSGREVRVTQWGARKSPLKSRATQSPLTVAMLLRFSKLRECLTRQWTHHPVRGSPCCKTEPRSLTASIPDSHPPPTHLNLNVYNEGSLMCTIYNVHLTACEPVKIYSASQWKETGRL